MPRVKKGTDTKSCTGTDTKKGTDTKSGTGVKKTGRPKGSKSGYTMSEKALAQRRATPMASASAPYEGDDITYNARQIQHIIHIQEIASTVDRNDPASMRSAFLQYLALCASDGCKVGNMAAYAAMGVNKSIVQCWEKSKKPGFKELAELVKTACALNRESMIADQKINPVIGIFWQRNFDGLRNDTESLQTPEQQDSASDDMTAEEYRNRYADLLDK